MPAAARRVERLCLTAEGEEGIARGRLLVEDALRIASFPVAAERRLVVIRQLELGVVDPDRSPAALAPVIEEAVRLAGAHVVRFDDPTAVTARAVYFPDAEAAATAFATDLATGVAGTKWFWPLVFPAWAQETDPEQGWRIVMDEMLAAPAGPLCFALVFESLLLSGLLDRTLGWLRPADATRLAVGLGLPRVGLGAPSARPRRVPPPIHRRVDATSEGRGDALPDATALARWYPAVRTCVRRWGRSDPRAVAVAAAAIVSCRPTLCGRAEIAPLVHRVLQTACRPASPVAPARADRRRAASTLPRDDGAAPAPVRARSDRRPDRSRSPASSAAARHSRTGRASAATSVAQASAATPDRDCEVTLDTPLWADWELRPSVAAGLLFLLPLLPRLGIAEVLRDRPLLARLEFPQRLLLLVADRIRVPRRDPVRAAIAIARRRRCPRLVHALLAKWMTRLQRALRRGAGMSMRALVRKPGQIAVTRTHVDAVFRLGDCDVRVRRAGLDVDPGWVPWLGRVVTFHYESEP